MKNLPFISVDCTVYLKLSSLRDKLAVVDLKEMKCKKVLHLRLSVQRCISIDWWAKINFGKNVERQTVLLSLKFFEALKFHHSMIIHLDYIIQVSDTVVILVVTHVLSSF